MTNDVSSVDRWLAFSEGELKMIRGALLTVQAGILADAEDGLPTDPDERKDASGTFLAASVLSFEIDDLLGVDHPSLDFTVDVAGMIRTGSYREVAAASRERSTKLDADLCGEAA